jgi:alanyl aminopeptidase
MFEQWAGEEAFRKGVRDYLSAHAWGNATAGDLLRALSNATGKDLAAPMSSFLDQPGLPMVTLEPLDGGKVRLTQERYLPAGAQRPAPQTWLVPMTLKYHDGAGVGTHNLLLRQATEIVDLGVPRIDWIEPNGGAWGYYRWKLPPDAMLALADAAGSGLDVRERMEYVYNAKALLDAGALHADGYLQVLPRFLRDGEPMVVGAALDGLEEIRDPLITPEVEEAYARYVRESVNPALSRFGLTHKAGEPEMVSLMRPRILTTLADDGRDPGTRAFGDSLARVFLADPAAIEPGLAPPALEIAALSDDAALRDRIREKFESAKSPAERRIYLNGLGAFRDPKLVDENLAYALAGPLKPQEIRTLLGASAAWPANRDRSWAFIQQNVGTILKRMPPMYGAFLPLYAGGCSRARIESAQKFFEDPEHTPPGAAQELAKASEAVDDCLGLRAREGPRVKAFLSGTAP